MRDSWAPEIGSDWLLRRGGRWDAQDRPVWSKKIRVRKLRDLKGLKPLQSHRLDMGEVQLTYVK